VVVVANAIGTGLCDYHRSSVATSRRCRLHGRFAVVVAVPSRRVVRPGRGRAGAAVYDSVLTSILNDLLPVRTVRCRRHFSDPWYDDDCRQMKRHLRRLEREFRKSELLSAEAY